VYVQVPVDQQQQLAAAAAARRPSAELRPPAAAGVQHEPGSLKFVDRDEHVYFWFPLLAGLSELTFDPRPEIRRSALEVRRDSSSSRKEQQQRGQQQQGQQEQKQRGR
jgi:hypothetical protein